MVTLSVKFKVEVLVETVVGIVIGTFVLAIVEQEIFWVVKLNVVEYVPFPQEFTALTLQ